MPQVTVGSSPNATSDTQHPAYVNSAIPFSSYYTGIRRGHRPTRLSDIGENDETYQDDMPEVIAPQMENVRDSESWPAVLTPDADPNEEESTNSNNTKQTNANEALPNSAENFEEFYDAIVQGDIETIKVHKHLDMIVGRKRDNGETPLIIAITEDQFEIAKVLLESGANVHQQVGTRSPLVCAVMGLVRAPRFIQLLLDFGATLNTLSGPCQYNALHWAAEYGRIDAVDFLISQGMDMEKTCPTGQTALLLAAENGHTHVANVLLAKGAELHHRSLNGGTALAWAVCNNHEETVIYLLKEGLDINDCDNSGLCALTAASSLGFIEIVNLLIEKGANVDCRSAVPKGFTPVMAAAVAGHANVVQVLIEYGADLSIEDGDGNTVLEAALTEGHSDTVGVLLESLGGHDYPTETKALEIALAKCPEYIKSFLPNEVDSINQILEQGGDLIKPRAMSNMMLTALLDQRLDIVEELLDNGVDPNKYLMFGYTPLNLAVERNDPHLVEKLLIQGADPAIEARSSDGSNYTPLHQALIALDNDINRDTSVINLLLRSGRCKIMKGARLNSTAFDYVLSKYEEWDHGVAEILTFRMLEHASDIQNDRSEDGSTLIHAAVRHDQKDLVDILLKKGLEIDATDAQGCTPFFRECQRGISMLPFLLERGANIGAKDKNSHNTLHAAISGDQLESVKFLINRGMQADTVGGDAGTPLTWAITVGNEEISLYLLMFGTLVINSARKNGRTMLHMAASQGMETLVSTTLERHYHNVNTKDNMGWTPLALACEKGSSKLITCLLDEGADIEVSNEHKNRPLHLALAWNNEPAAQTLIQQGANVSTLDSQNRMPLHIAVQNGLEQTTAVLLNCRAEVSALDARNQTPLCTCPNPVIAQLLIQNGASVHHVDINGWTPLHHAVAGNHLETFEVLHRAGAALADKTIDDGLSVSDRVDHIIDEKTRDLFMSVIADVYLDLWCEALLRNERER
ncbi:ankyrin repeat-containing domain protein [Phaeosphaeriaceae sp. PMI808]|nr:ankyrin repeat-containing domain protein [Phaeosphaeriaceae sp. PMI808]